MLSWYRHAEGRIPQCTVDESLVAQMAAGFSSIAAFVSSPTAVHRCARSDGDQLKAAFTAYLRSKSLGCHCLEPKASHDLYLPSETDHVQLMHWLQGLPKRTGLLAFDSLQRGRWSRLAN